MKKLTLICLIVFTAMLATAGNVALVHSKEDPWKWTFSLRGDASKKPILMPTGLWIDAERQRYYVVDSGNSRLLSFDQNGAYLNAFNAGNSLEAPYDMYREEDGTIWVVEKGKNSLTSIDLQSKKITPHTLAVHGTTVYPDRVKKAGDAIYILDRASGDVVVFNENLQYVKTYGCSDCGLGFGDFEIKGDILWAMEKSKPVVYKYSLQGEKLATIQLRADNLEFPYAIEIGPGDIIYLLDRHNGSVSVFDQQGKFKYSAFSLGHVRGKLYYPEDLLLDPWGRLCVIDSGNGRIEVFSR